MDGKAGQPLCAPIDPELGVSVQEVSGMKWLAKISMDGGPGGYETRRGSFQDLGKECTYVARWF